MNQNLRLSVLLVGLVGAVGVGVVRAVASPSQERLTPSVQRVSPSSMNERIYLVDASGVEGIQLGMTLDEARRAMSTAKFARALELERGSTQ
jgi:hypothetical protein